MQTVMVLNRVMDYVGKWVGNGCNKDPLQFYTEAPKKKGPNQNQFVSPMIMNCNVYQNTINDNQSKGKVNKNIYISEKRELIVLERGKKWQNCLLWKILSHA